METTQEISVQLTRYYIDLPFIKEQEETNQPRIVYGYDPESKAEGMSGYYVCVNNKRTGKTMLSEGYNSDLPSLDLLLILEEYIPTTIKETPELLLLEKHKLLIAAGLPF